MIPHVHVHRGGDHDRNCGRQIKRGKKVSRDALREVRQNVRGGRDDKQRVNGLRHRNVFDGGIEVGFMLLAGSEHAGDDFFSGERGEGKRSYEFLGGAGHDDLHLDAAVLHQAYDLRSLVRRDSASNAERNLHKQFRSSSSRNAASKIAGREGLILPQSFVESLGSLLGSAASFGNFPFHFAGADLILGNAAGLAGIGVHHWWGAGLELPRTPRCDQDVAIVAVEAFDQLHWDVPLET